MIAFTHILKQFDTVEKLLLGNSFSRGFALFQHCMSARKPLANCKQEGKVSTLPSRTQSSPL